MLCLFLKAIKYKFRKNTLSFNGEICILAQVFVLVVIDTIIFNNFIYCVKLVYCLHQCLNLHNPPIRKFLEAKKTMITLWIHASFYIHSHVSIHAAVDISTTKLRRTQSKFFIKPKMGVFYTTRRYMHEKCMRLALGFQQGSCVLHGLFGWYTWLGYVWII